MPPIIICGMHRSGTSLVCRALESAGLFVGEAKEHNHEAVFFLTLNQWIFEQFGASWDNPYNMRFINDDLAGYMLSVINNIVHSSSAASFTGTDPRYQQVFSPDNQAPWGWKDPRNTFTAAIWAAAFTDAKLVHVCRNPLDVAASLRQREQEIMERHQVQLAHMTPEQLDGTLRFQQSPRLFHLEEGLALWEEYTAQALMLERQFGTNAIRVRYEDFLADPVTELGRLADFAGLDAGSAQLQATVAQVNPQRRYAFMTDRELTSRYRNYRQRDIMRSLGYDALDENCVSAA
ncbi:MAG: sulfotransferase [Gammaproteobacteria bacterium]